jgi:hypothetical protein
LFCFPLLLETAQLAWNYGVQIGLHLSILLSLSALLCVEIVEVLCQAWILCLNLKISMISQWEQRRREEEDKKGTRWARHARWTRSGFWWICNKFCKLNLHFITTSDLQVMA